MAAQSKEIYAKMASSIDRNRKIRRGGRDARDVYLWVLRRVAERGVTNWRIPAEDVQDADYLADDLMCTPEEARTGLERAILVRLLAIEGDECIVCGGDDEWARKAMTGSERTAKWKKSRSGDEETVTRPSAVDAEVTKQTSPADTLLTEVTAKNAGDVGEERRGEERNVNVTPPLALISDRDQTEDPEPKRTPGADLAEACCEVLNRLTGSNYQPETLETARLARKLASRKATAAEVRAVTEDRVKAWRDDAKMREYLRPATLLAESKFMAYREDLRARPKRLVSVPSSGSAAPLRMAEFKFTPHPLPSLDEEPS